MQELRQGTSIDIIFGPVPSATGGVTPVTGMVLASADAAGLVKHGATSRILISGRTHGMVSGLDGYYAITLTTADTDTEGMLVVGVNDTSLMLPTVWRGKVVAQEFWDAKYATGNPVRANVIEINGSATGAAQLARSSQAIAFGTATAGGDTTTIPVGSIDITISVADQFNGRIVIFLRDTTTTGLRGQATDITDTATNGNLSVTALTNAPVNGDTFIIV